WPPRSAGVKREIGPAGSPRRARAEAASASRSKASPGLPIFGFSWAGAPSGMSGPDLWNGLRDRLWARVTGGLAGVVRVFLRAGGRLFALARAIAPSHRGRRTDEGGDALRSSALRSVQMQPQRGAGFPVFALDGFDQVVLPNLPRAGFDGQQRRQEGRVADLTAGEGTAKRDAIQCRRIDQVVVGKMQIPDATALVAAWRQERHDDVHAALEGRIDDIVVPFLPPRGDER